MASVAAFLATSAHAEGVDAGTLIENTASATYEGGDGPTTIDSNTVSLRVDELLDVTVTSLDSGPIASRPGTEVLTFEITNIGNGPEAYRLVVAASQAGNDFDAVVDSIAVDTNGNGTYDAGIDQVLTAPQTTSLVDADANLTVFVVVSVPAGVADGDTSSLALRADAVTGTGAAGTIFAGEGAGGSNAIVGAGGATGSATGSLIVGITTASLVKSALVADPFGGTSPVPGAIVTYTINAQVTGSGSVDNLVVSDAIPAGTTYRAGTLALDGSALTDQSGDDAGEASSTGVSVDLGTVAGGTTRAITFEVEID